MLFLRYAGLSDIWENKAQIIIRFKIKKKNKKSWVTIKVRPTLHRHFESGLDGYHFELIVIGEKLCSITPGIKAIAAKSCAKLVSLCQTLMCFSVLLNHVQNSSVPQHTLGIIDLNFHT